MFEDERTRQLKSFDPFKNRIAADFFDPHIMFGINDGFDAVIGNPPYIHFEKMEKTIRDFYKNNSKKFEFTTYAARGDMYTLFYEKGVQLLKEGGFLSFITSNKWMRAGYGEKLRDFFLKETNPIELIDLGAGMFESATVDTNILLLQKGENHHQLKALTLGEDGSENMSVYIRRHAVSIDYKVGESWTILSEIEQSIKKKIEAVGTPLKDWDIKINRGILTGLNEAFIISKEKRDELVKVDPKSAEIIRPILRGRDIKRYEVNFQNLYLINTHNGYVSEDGETVPPINVDDYPAIKDWFENGNWNTKLKLGTNIERLTKRTDQGVTPYNLRSLAYMDDFSKLKILFSEIVQSPQFYLDENNFIMNDTVTFISGLQLEYLVKYLNSRIIFSIYKSFYAGGGLGTNGIRVKKTFLQNLPIPKIQINSVKDEDIEKEVQEIIGLSSHEVHHLSEM
ncbi:Eco57I restriction-modification methylase domain-containing protein [Enterococcus faecalis]|nr:Eco57I restriction-modification methylase domain-containing protein [Enterococcus faecalis]